ncbi:biotin/lipoyl-containing protein [Pseudonocardia lutea]|uniref:Biotin/lipoyl-containing protein n=1 Tax=Pseudonocardia lutea TaxID=2172015 RepID=A0ABW1ICG2_9PSEU
MSELVEVKIPFSGSVENVEINEWLVAEGDVIAEGDSLADVSTDKVDTELEAEAAGRLVKIYVAAGTEIPVGTTVALLADPDADAEVIAKAVAEHVPSSPDA